MTNGAVSFSWYGWGLFVVVILVLAAASKGFASVIVALLTVLIILVVIGNYQKIVTMFTTGTSPFGGS